MNRNGEGLHEDMRNIYLIGKTDSYEFLKREFHWNVIDLDQRVGSGFAQEKEILAFDFSNIEKVIDIISTDYDRQFILILLGNETQQMKLVKHLAKMKRVQAIYTQYEPQPSVLGGMKTCLIHLIESPRTFFNLNFFLICLRGAFRGFKSLIYLGIPKIRNFPLGYSNRFVEELKISGLIVGESESLMNARERFWNKNRKAKVFFKGQLTGEYRKLIAPYLMRRKLVEFDLNQHWGRPDLLTSTAYVDSMIESKFVYCPPGHVSNDTFRRTEALICGALPIETESSPQNWQKCHNSFTTAKLSRYSIVHILGKALMISEIERKKLLCKFHDELRSEILEVISDIKNQTTSA